MNHNNAINIYQSTLPNGTSRPPILSNLLTTESPRSNQGRNFQMQHVGALLTQPGSIGTIVGPQRPLNSVGPATIDNNNAYTSDTLSSTTNGLLFNPQLQQHMIQQQRLVHYNMHPQMGTGQPHMGMYPLQLQKNIRQPNMMDQINQPNTSPMLQRVQVPTQMVSNPCSVGPATTPRPMQLGTMFSNQLVATQPPSDGGQQQLQRPLHMYHSYPATPPLAAPEPSGVQLARFLIKLPNNFVMAADRQERLTPPVVEALGCIVDRLTEAVILGTDAAVNAQIEGEKESMVLEGDKWLTNSEGPVRGNEINCRDVDRYIKRHFE